MQAVIRVSCQVCCCSCDVHFKQFKKAAIAFSGNKHYVFSMLWKQHGHFIASSNWRKQKQKKRECQGLSWPARICILSDAAKGWIVVSQQCVRNEGINSAMNLLPDIYYLPAYASQCLVIFGQFKPWQMRTLIPRKNSGFCAFVRPWQLAFFELSFL